MWYMRVITIRLIVLIELALLVESFIFNTASSATGELHFANDRFMCSTTRRIWVFYAQLFGYFVVSMAFAIFSIVALYLLIMRQRRAISCLTQSSGMDEKGARNIGDNKTENKSSLSPARQENNQNVGGDSNIEKMKTASKVIASISGVFWITAVPSIINGNIIVTNIAAGNNSPTALIKFKIMARVSRFIGTASWFINPMIYLYVNPHLRSKMVKIARNLCSRN